jgi:hypothetical protein
MLHEPLPEMTWIYHLDRDRNVMMFEALCSQFRVDLPVEPMLGTVGVAPAAREVRSSLVPDRFGGNMDTPTMRAGATCYLGVNVEGALFSVDDGHYRQGEGEACGVAVEGAMNVTLVVDLIKGGAPGWPRIENDEEFIVIGSSRPLEDAWRIAQVEMVHWLGELYGLDPMDGYQLVTQAAQAPLANVVDPNYSATVKIAKACCHQPRRTATSTPTCARPRPHCAKDHRSRNRLRSWPVSPSPDGLTPSANREGKATKRAITRLAARLRPPRSCVRPRFAQRLPRYTRCYRTATGDVATCLPSPRWLRRSSRR